MPSSGRMDHQQLYSSMNAFPTSIITQESAIMNQGQSSNNLSPANQMTSLQLQNQQLQRRLQNKSAESEKLMRKIERTDHELQTYKNLIQQIQVSLNSSGNLEGVKYLVAQACNNMKNSKNSQLNQAALLKMKQRSMMKTGNVCRANGKVKCSCESERPYACEYPDCGKRFLQKHHLDSHRQCHSGQRYICEWPNCGKSFVRKYNLQEHTKCHEDESHNRCMYPGCGMVFSSKYSLLRHQTAQHELKLG